MVVSKWFWVCCAAIFISCAETKFESSQKSTIAAPEKKSFDQTPEVGVSVEIADPEEPDVEKANSGIVVDQTGMIQLTFIDETAGFLNSLGWYKVDAKGAILDPDIIWENASHSSGSKSVKQNPKADGPIQPGDQATVGPIKEGESVRFFLIADGYDQNNWTNQNKSQYIDLKSGRFEFRTSKKYDESEPAFVTSNSPYLFYISDDSEPLLIKSRSGVQNTGSENAIYHAAYDNEKSLNLNPDKHNHIRHSVLEEKKKWKIGVEDLYYFEGPNQNEYDGDFEDLVFEVELLTDEDNK